MYIDLLPQAVMEESTITSWSLEDNILTVTETIDVSNLPKRTLFGLKFQRIQYGVTYLFYEPDESAAYPKRFDFTKYRDVKEFSTSMYLKQSKLKKEFDLLQFTPTFDFFVKCIRSSYEVIGHCKNTVIWASNWEMESRVLQFEPLLTVPDLKAIQSLLLMMRKVYASNVWVMEVIDTNVAVRTYDTTLQKYVILPRADYERINHEVFQTTKMPSDPASAAVFPKAIDPEEDVRWISPKIHPEITNYTTEWTQIEDAHFTFHQFYLMEFIITEILIPLEVDDYFLSLLLDTNQKEYHILVESILLRLYSRFECVDYEDGASFTRQLIESLYLRNLYPDRIQLHFGQLKVTWRDGEVLQMDNPYIHLYPQLSTFNKDWHKLYLKGSGYTIMTEEKGGVVVPAGLEVLEHPKVMFNPNPTLFLHWQANFIRDQILPLIQQMPPLDRVLFKEKVDQWYKFQMVLFLSLKRFAGKLLESAAPDTPEIDLGKVLVVDASPLNSISSKYTAR